MWVAYGRIISAFSKSLGREVIFHNLFFPFPHFFTHPYIHALYKLAVPSHSDAGVVNCLDVAKGMLADMVQKL